MRNESGSVYTEFALVIPALALFAFGILFIQRGLDHASILMQASNESWLAGSGSAPTAGMEKMNTVSNIFQSQIDAEWTGFQIQAQYDSSNPTFPLVQVGYNADVVSTPLFAAFNLNTTLTGPHVARNLSVANPNGFGTLEPTSCSGAGCAFTCEGDPCGPGTGNPFCESAPC